MAVDIQACDFLAGNDHVYARKARRKKIALVRVDVTNGEAVPVVVQLGSSALITAGSKYHAEEPAVIIRKLGEFTWDFLLYSIIDFHPVTAVLDMAVFLTGPLYKRRLRRQLNELTHGELLVKAGESETAVVAFRGVTQKPEQLTTVLRVGDEEIGKALPIAAC